MLSDLLIGPSPTCQHGNRKLHRRQLPRNLSPVFWIMKRHPAPAERNHTLRDPLIRLRIPVPDTSLDQPPLSRRHIPQRQIRIPIQNTRRKLQLNNPAGQIPPRDLTTLLRLPRKIKKLSPRNIPQIHIHKPLNNLPSPPRLKRRIQKRQNHIITHTLHSLQNPGSPQRPPSKPNQQTFTTIIIQNPPKINLNITQKLQHPPPHTQHIQRSADGTPPPGSPQENSTSHSQKTERTDCQPSHKKRAPGPNTQELSQNQTTSSTPPQLPQLPLQPIRTRRY